MARAMGVAIRVVLLGLAALAMARAVRVAAADLVMRRAGPDAAERAEKILPGNPNYHYARALALEEKQPGSAEIGREFQTAVEENPRYTDALLAWSVEQELAGKTEAAHGMLVQAQAGDKLLKPAWALANYYYRQGDAEHFWPEARRCLEVIANTKLAAGRFFPEPVFALCWRMTENAEDILNRAVIDEPAMRASYLNYLSGTNRIGPALEVAGRIAAHPLAWQLESVLPFDTALINQGRVEAAVKLWNQLVASKALNLEPVDEGRHGLLGDPGLVQPPTNLGFDWRPGYPDSVRFTYEAEHVYRFDFDGTAPEHFLLLTIPAPMSAGRYTLTAKYDADFDAERSGLRWTVEDREHGRVLRAQAAVEAASSFKVLTEDFVAPEGTRVGWLTLSYEREPGTVPVRGGYELKGVGLEKR